MGAVEIETGKMPHVQLVTAHPNKCCTFVLCKIHNKYSDIYQPKNTCVLAGKLTCYQKGLMFRENTI